MLSCVPYFSSKIILLVSSKTPNGLRYLRWGGDGEAVQLEKG
jgi:hypothetical protein